MRSYAGMEADTPAPAAPPRPLLRTPQAAEILNIRPGTLLLWGRQGKVEPVRFGHTLRWRLEDIERLAGGS